MTGFLHEKEFSRRTFVKGGGALIVGFSLAGASLAGKAAADYDPNGLYQGWQPDPSQVDSWLTINADNTASIKTGRLELGQGSATGMLQIVGEELGMDMNQLEFVRHETGITPNTNRSSASDAIKIVGPALRAVGAHARQTLVGLASSDLGVPVSSLSVSKGVVSGGGKSIAYGDLVGGKLLNITLPASYKMELVDIESFLGAGLQAGVAPAKPISSYTLVGARVPRIDIPEMVTGTFTYLHNIRLPGMVHGRIIRPRGQGAYGDGTAPKVLSVDQSSIQHIPDVQIVRKGDFLGVVAAREYEAIQAAAQLKVKWADPPPISGSGNYWKSMRDVDAAGKTTVVVKTDTGGVDSAIASAAHAVSATYGWPYNGHFPIGPLCCVADVKPDHALVLSNTQDAYATRDYLAQFLGMPPESVQVQAWAGSSPYGSGTAYQDIAQAAVLMSQAVGKPVRLQFMRWDEHGWDNYGTTQMMDFRAGIDADGKIVAWENTMFGLPFITRGQGEPTVQLRGGVPPAQPASNFGSAGAPGGYKLPQQRLVTKWLPLMNNYFKTDTLRTVNGIPSAFGNEQMMDELAYAAKLDPIAFRMKNFDAASADRWAGVVNAVQALAKWSPKVSASNLSSGAVVSGRGIAFQGGGLNYTATVADVEVNKKSGKVSVKHLYTAHDAGLIINPELVENQIVGGNVWAASRVLLEEVRFDTKRVTSLDWVSYPTLRFKDSPTVTAAIVQRNDQPPGGIGEPPQEAVPPAIANAFFDATGVRMRTAPLSPARVRAALKGAGVA